MKRIHCKVLMLLMMLSLLPIVMTRIKKFSRLKTDPLSKTRCDLVCQNVAKESKPECRTQCKDKEVKPGTCPSSDSPKWAEACVEACDVDYQCEGTQKCCHHGCGSSCSVPLDLLTLPGLPAIPTIGELKERKRSTVVKWSDGVGDLARTVPERTLYLLEEQHHLGPKYEEPRLGVWNLILRTNKTKVSLKDVLKPGRWYRFRVASVSAAGTRGYSAPSAPYTPRRLPRPPPQPKKLKVTPLKSNNGTITVRLQWKEPKSDMPVMRYKVFWSRRLRGIQKSELDSVVVNHKTVPKDQTHYDITDLQPNSLYFLQVQTISQFGLGKLRSDKAEIFYNTTSSNSLSNEKPAEQRQKQRRKKLKGLKMSSILWNNNRIKARIVWEPLPNNRDFPRRYFIRWEKVSCETSKNNAKKELTATTEESSFELYELDYACTYKVNVNRSRNSKLKSPPDSELLITIPPCKNFQRKMSYGNKINCQ